jgi:lactoylglutathione lyase
MMMRIRDPKDSLHFYVTLMGMRSVFTMNTGPYTIYYLGYPSESSRSDGERHIVSSEDGLKHYGEETCANLQHTLGLLELYHVHGSERQPKGYYSSGNDPARGLGFSHLGFTVPDVRSTLKYLRANGVEVIKDVGPGTSTRRAVPISEAEEKLGVGVGDYEGDVVEERGKTVELREEYTKVFDEIAFVADPDGYTVELVPQGVDPLA